MNKAQKIETINEMLAIGYNKDTIAEELGLTPSKLDTFMNQNRERIIQPPTMRQYRGVEALWKDLGIATQAAFAARVDMAWNRFHMIRSSNAPRRPSWDTVAEIALGLQLPQAAVYLHLLEVKREDLTEVIKALKSQGIDWLDIEDAAEDIYLGDME